MAAAIVTNPINFGHSALIAHPIAEKMAHTMSDKKRLLPDAGPKYPMHLASASNGSGFC